MSYNFNRRNVADQFHFMQHLVHESDIRLEPGYDDTIVGDDQFDRRAREIQRTPGGAPISIVPAKQGPWSGNNQLGIEKPFSADANNLQTILRLDEWGYPEVWTVMLGLDVDTDRIGTDGFSIVAFVSAGSGGAVQQFEVDWQNGASFSTVMNALDVVAYYEDPIGSLADGIRLRATLGRGCLSHRVPTRTKAIFASAGAAGDPIIVPPFATRVMLLPNETFAPPFPPNLFYDPSNLLRFQRSTTATDGVVIGADTFLKFPDGIPIPNGVRTIQLVSNVAIDLGAQAVFSLAL